MIRKLLFTLCVLALPTMASAQFFDFGFGRDPFMQRRQQQQEPYTAPEFKGGDKAVQAFQQKHFKNPQDAGRDVEGVVVVACIVDEKGRVSETHIVRSLGTPFDQEAQRVCRKMKFRPARLGKKKVKGRFDVTFPVRRSRLSFSRLQTVDV